MSVRENMQFFHHFDIDDYLETLKAEHGAREHPSQAGCYLVDELPFYEPKWIEDHVSILSFNYAPLPGVLIEALANHPELVPDDVVIQWTIEQEVLLEATMGKIRKQGL